MSLPVALIIAGICVLFLLSFVIGVVLICIGGALIVIPRLGG